MSFSAPQLPLQNLKLNRYSFTSTNARGVIICLDNGYLLSNAAPNAVGSLCHKGVKLAHFLWSTTLLWILSCRAVVQNDQKFRYWACFEKKKKKASLQAQSFLFLSFLNATKYIIKILHNLLLLKPSKPSTLLTVTFVFFLSASYYFLALKEKESNSWLILFLFPSQE